MSDFIDNVDSANNVASFVNDTTGKPFGKIPSIIEGYFIDPAKLLEANQQGGFEAMTKELSKQLHNNLNVPEVGKHSMEILVARQLVNIAKQFPENFGKLVEDNFSLSGTNVIAKEGETKLDVLDRFIPKVTYDEMVGEITASVTAGVALDLSANSNKIAELLAAAGADDIDIDIDGGSVDGTVQTTTKLSSSELADLWLPKQSNEF